MDERRTSGWRTFGGLLLAFVTAPVAMAACVSFASLPTPPDDSISWVDVIGGGLTFLLFALVFGTVLAALPGLVLGSLIIATARACDTRSPTFYASAGLLAGLLMAWVDTGRTHSALQIGEAIPLIFGGCASALTSRAVAERSCGRGLFEVCNALEFRLAAP